MLQPFQDGIIDLSLNISLTTESHIPQTLIPSTEQSPRLIWTLGAANFTLFQKQNPLTRPEGGSC